MADLYLNDHQILFDVHPLQLKQKPGENILLSSEGVFDVKGNPNVDGAYQLTNLRVIWYSLSDACINLSIGLGTIFHYECKFAATVISGAKNELLLRTKIKASRYEFSFTCEDRTVIEAIKPILESYQKCAIYREIKISGNIIAQNNLNLCKQEQVINKYNNIYSISTDKNDVLGILYLTNIRVVWYSQQNEQFNISVPWITIKKLIRKNIKSQPTFVIETYSEFGGFIMGYRIKDQEILVKEIEKLHAFYLMNPIYGVEYDVSSKKQPLMQFEEDVKVVDIQYNHQGAYKLNEMNQDCEIVVSKELGLAMERLPDDVKLSDLWRIII